MGYKGGVEVTEIAKTKRFVRDYKKLTDELRDLVDSKLTDILSDPMPRGLRFEKLKGIRNPDVYTIHITGNYKLSMEIKGSKAVLRRVAPHDEMDRCP